MYNFIDWNAAFKNEGILDDKYSEDGVHLNQEGYDLYYSLIKEYL